MYGDSGCAKVLKSYYYKHEAEKVWCEDCKEFVEWYNLQRNYMCSKCNGWIGFPHPFNEKPFLISKGVIPFISNGRKHTK